MKILGVDTLEFGLDVSDYEEGLRPMLDIFRIYKEEGQKEFNCLELEINGANFVVAKSGIPFYAFKLSCNDFIICFADKTTKNLPQIWLRFLAPYLWSYGYKQAYEHFLDWFSYFNVNVIKTRISRLDICVDTDEVEFFETEIDEFITRAKSKKTHYVSEKYKNGRLLSGFTIGRGQPLLARIYDKTREIKSSNKIWFKDIWNENGWDENKDVWRVEFQLRRKILKEIKIDQVTDLWGKETSLWNYLTSKWLKLAHKTDNNVSRWKVKDKWKLIREAGLIGEASPLVREKVIMGNLVGILNQASGLVTAISAMGNYKDINQALGVIKGWHEVKLANEGIDFERKVSNKRKKYSGLNS